MSRATDPRGPRGAVDHQRAGDAEGRRERRQLRAERARLLVVGERDDGQRGRRAALRVQVEPVQGLAQAPRVDGGRRVALEQLRPVGGILRPVRRDRREYRQPDRVRDLVAQPEPAVAAGQGQRDDRPAWRRPARPGRRTCRDAGPGCRRAWRRLRAAGAGAVAEVARQLLVGGDEDEVDLRDRVGELDRLTCRGAVRLDLDHVVGAPRPSPGPGRPRR